MTKKYFLSILSLLVLLSWPCALAGQVYQSYTYNHWGVPLEAPELYSPEKTYYPVDGEGKAFKQPQDMFVNPADETVYIADSENNRIVILDNQFKFIKEIKEFTVDPEALGLSDKQKKDKLTTSSTLSYPGGVFAGGDGCVYIADRDNKRILVSDADGQVIKILLQPESDVNFSGIDFLPVKVAVDSKGYVFALCKGVYSGALVYAPDGGFSGYFGANKTEVTAAMLADAFWRRFASAEQKAKMKKYVPVEFSNLDIDAEGFVYTTTLITTEYREQLKKFNAGSANILPHNPNLAAKFDGIYGDMERVRFKSDTYETRFTDVCYRSGFLYALDMERGRIFQYDDNGVQAGVFGGIGSQTGTFTTPVAIDSTGDRILVLDAAKGNITAFVPTKYALQVQAALSLYNQSRYAESLALWTEIAGQNNNSSIAQIGMAKAYYEQEEYTAAMKHFKQGQDREGYSKAYQYYRNELMKQIIPVAVCILAALYVLYRIFIKKKREKRPPKEGFSRLRWLGYTLVHPVKGFTDCKEKKQHSVMFGIGITALLFAALIVQRQFTGFPFNTNDPMKINILLIFAQSAVLLTAWSFSNWAVSTLADGKGRVSEIFYSTAVSLSPYLVSIVLNVVLSNLLTLEEGMFLTWISGLGMLWSLMLLFFSQMTVHEYSASRVLGTIVLTVALLVVVAFILFLFFSLFQQVTQFFKDIFNEISFRNLKT